MNKIFFLIYFLFLILLVIFSYLFIDTNLIYLKFLFSNIAFQKRQVVTIIYICFIIGFFCFYFFILTKAFTQKISFQKIKILLFGQSLILLFSYPAMLSYDIFNYIATSKVLFFYHENPYIIMPVTFVGDPLLLFMHAANKIALYGFVWIFLSGIPFLFGFSNFLLTLFSFKLFMIMFYLASCLLLWKLSKNLVVVTLFAFNPLVIIEILISGHNDIVMVFLILLGYLFIQKNRIGLGILFVFLSIFIKYASVFLLPVVILLIWKKLHKQYIVWDKMYLLSFWFMFVIFLLSPLREELYPWYAIWFLPFVCLMYKRTLILFLSFGLCFGLLLRYVPFMLLGTYFGPTPMLRIGMTVGGIMLALIIYLINKWYKFFL